MGVRAVVFTAVLFSGAPAVAIEWERARNRDAIDACLQDYDACLEFAAVALDWYEQHPRAVPYCLRDGDDPLKTFVALFTWYFTVYRQQYDAPFVEPLATSIRGRPMSWDELLDGLAVASAPLMSARYPCADFEYPPGVSVLIRYD